MQQAHQAKAAAQQAVLGRAAPVEDGARRLRLQEESVLKQAEPQVAAGHALDHTTAEPEHAPGGKRQAGEREEAEWRGERLRDRKARTEEHSAMDAEQPDLRSELTHAADSGLMCELSGQAQGTVLGGRRKLPAVPRRIFIASPGDGCLERRQEKLVHRVEGGHSTSAAPQAIRPKCEVSATIAISSGHRGQPSAPSSAHHRATPPPVFTRPCVQTFAEDLSLLSNRHTNPATEAPAAAPRCPPRWTTSTLLVGG